MLSDALARKWDVAKIQSEKFGDRKMINAADSAKLMP
jgi:hypothetical protein